MSITFTDIMTSAGAVGRRFFSFEDYDKALDKAIAQAMNGENSRVQVNARAVIVKNAEERVYNTYPNPGIEWSRRYNHNGILDPSTYRSQSSTYAHHSRTLDATLLGNYGSGKGFTTYISAETEWQQRFGGSSKDNPNSLVYAIEENGLYHAPPRPYMDHAESEYAEKYFEKDLVLELEDNGF